MKRMFLAVGVAAICSAGVFAADDSVPVQITGCVVDGDGGSFILTGVQERSAGGTMSPASAIYWLSTTKGLKQQVGHEIEITGTFSPSRDEGKTGRIIITPDPATGLETLQVENGAKTAEATATDAAGPTGIVGTSGETTEITKPYRRLQVRNLRMIAEQCAR
jgi:hypothetical protein